jgi:hypothetical protein
MTSIVFELLFKRTVNSTEEFPVTGGGGGAAKIVVEKKSEV